MKKIFLSILFLSSFFYSRIFYSKTIPLAQAQLLQNKPLSLSVSPPTAYLHLKPDESLLHTISLKNTGDQTLSVTMQLTDFKPDGVSGKPILSNGTVFDKAINPNLSFGEPFLIEPNENRSISLRLDTAKLSVEKEYPLTVLFHAKSVSNGAGEGSGASVAGTIASNLILFISPNEESQGELLIENVDAPIIVDSFFPIQISILAKNVGLNAMPIRGELKIKNIMNQVIDEYIFYPDRVLADSTRQIRGAPFSAQILDENQELDPEKVKNLQTKFSYKSLFLLGPYKISINLDQQQREITVIALPISLLALIIIGVLMYVSYTTLRKKIV